MTMVLLPAIDTTLKSGAGIPRHSGATEVDLQNRLSCAVPPVSTLDRLSPPHETPVDAPQVTSRPASPPPNHPASPAPTDDGLPTTEAKGLVVHALRTTEPQLPTPTTPPNLFPPSPTLSAADAKSCRQLLSSIQRHQAAWPFREPVDPIAAGAPDYFDVIKTPMDLSTIENKLATHQYESVEEFSNDLQLIITNCCTYNPPTHLVHQLAKTLGNYCSQQLSKIFPALATSSCTDRRSKRDVKPPRVFEPEEIPIKKPRLEGSKNPKKRKSLSEDHGDKITNLFANLDQMQAELASLRRGSTRVNRSPSPAPSPPASVPKRRRKSKAQDPELSEAAPMELDPVLRQPADAPKTVEPPVVPVTPKSCEYCKTSDTPMWRRGPSGKGTLCNKCGVKWRSGKIMGGDGTGPALPKFTPIRQTKKPKAGDPIPLPPISFAQKVELTKLITTLDGHQMQRVVKIVQEGMPELEETEDIELDIEKIDNNTLSKMYDYVIKACGIGASVLDLPTTSRRISKDKKPRAKPGERKAGAVSAAVAFPVAAESAGGLGGGWGME